MIINMLMTIPSVTNTGAIFVTQPPASDSVASETCGELAISPCLDIKSAIQQATDGATIYVGPGESSRNEICVLPLIIHPRFLSDYRGMRIIVCWFVHEGLKLASSPCPRKSQPTGFQTLPIFLHDTLCLQESTLDLEILISLLVGKTFAFNPLME